MSDHARANDRLWRVGGPAIFHEGSRQKDDYAVFHWVNTPSHARSATLAGADKRSEANERKDDDSFRPELRRGAAFWKARPLEPAHADLQNHPNARETRIEGMHRSRERNLKGLDALAQSWKLKMQVDMTIATTDGHNSKGWKHRSFAVGSPTSQWTKAFAPGTT